jgi:AcrR family transcriptional regulator
MSGTSPLAVTPTDHLAQVPFAAGPSVTRPGRPRSDRAQRDILVAFREILVEEGYASLRLEHVAARAKVGKATIYRHWGSKQALAQDLLHELATPHISVPDVGDTWSELLSTVRSAMRAVTETEFGQVIRALLSEIASDPTLGDPFRETVVQARRDETARVIARGIARGDLRQDVDADIASELLIGPVYFRILFGGTLDRDFAERVVRSFLQGFART